MKTTTFTLKIANNPNLNEESKKCPLPINIIPNYMGINLCNVKEVSWTEQEDCQLTNINIVFIPGADGVDD